MLVYQRVKPQICGIWGPYGEIYGEIYPHSTAGLKRGTIASLSVLQRLVLLLSWISHVGRIPAKFHKDRHILNMMLFISPETFDTVYIVHNLVISKIPCLSLSIWYLRRLAILHLSFDSCLFDLTCLTCPAIQQLASFPCYVHI